MTELLEQHPDLESLLRLYPELKTYRILNERGNISEYWERNDAGVWIDQTEREKLREKLIEAKEKLDKLKEKEAGHHD